MSNRYNASRATLPRPKVCKSPPPVPAPLPEPTCNLIITGLPVFQGEKVDPKLETFDPTGDPTDHVEVFWTAPETDAPASSLQPINSNTQYSFNNTYGSSPKTISIHAVFPSGLECDASVTFATEPIP